MIRGAMVMLGIAGALSCTLWASAEAQTPSAPPLPTVNSAAMDAHRKYLADDLLEGRAPATRGGELAARYIAAQFEALGLAPGAADGSYYQPVTLVGLTPHPTMRWGVAQKQRSLRYLDDFVAWSERQFRSNRESISWGGRRVGAKSRAAFTTKSGIIDRATSTVRTSGRMEWSNRCGSCCGWSAQSRMTRGCRSGFRVPNFNALGG